MSVYRPKKSPFYHFDFVAGGQRHHGSTHCESKSAARDFERRLRNQIASGAVSKPDCSIDEACGLYWEECARFQDSAATTERQIEQLTALLGQSTLLRDLDRGQVEHYIARRRAMRARNKKALVTNATVNREVELLGRVLRHVAARYAVAAIEWKGLKLREPPERVRELSSDEETALFAQLDPDLAALVEFAMLSGQRRTALITLLWSKVDFAGARAEVRMKGGGWHSFPLTARMSAILAARPKVGPFVFTYRCKRHAPARGDRPHRVKGQRYPFSRDGWRRAWRTALDDAGITDFRFHDLRHTTATRVTRATGNLKVTQRLLGHTTIATTARYAHAVEDDIRAALLAAESRNSPEPSKSERGKNDRKLRRTAQSRR